MKSSSRARTLFSGILILTVVSLTAAQWNGYPSPTYSPSTNWQPTFADLNTYSYQYTTLSPYQGQNIRIWPYVIGQYYYPYTSQYYNNNGGYDPNNWNWYNQYNQGYALTKK